MKKLPQHGLIVYARACELLRAVMRANIADSALRRQATEAAQSVCLNISEAAGRVTRADKARAFTIARGECVEASAAVEVALISGAATEIAHTEVASIASEVYAMLTALIRR